MYTKASRGKVMIIYVLLFGMSFKRLEPQLFLTRISKSPLPLFTVIVQGGIIEYFKQGS